jgi:hypothetical protein
VAELKTKSMTLRDKKERLLKYFNGCGIQNWKIRKVQQSQCLGELYHAFNLRSKAEESRLETAGMNIKNEIMSFRRVLSPRRAYVIYTPMGNRR